MDEIHELLTRGVDKIYPSKEVLEKVLRSGKKLKLYQGFDPTGIQMHIGHMIGLRKLAQWQKLGHKVIFLIGDGTGQAGDPSGKTRSREKYLSNEELRANAKDYVMQAAKIVSFEGENPVEILYNGEWLNKLALKDVLEIAGHFTLQQMLERDLYQDRLKNNEPLSLREFMYPLLQGYDSVAMEVDLELGGSDQTFNMLVGRQLVRDYLNKEKFVMTTPLLTDSAGKKIGKTEGNVIALNDSPDQLYAKIMSLSDDVIVKGLEYLTDIPMEEIKNIEEKLASGENPMQFKHILAFEIVKQLNSEKDAKKGEEYFRDVVQNKNVSSISIPQFDGTIEADETLVDVLVKVELAASKSEARRLLEQKAITVDGEAETNMNYQLQSGEHILSRANKKFVRITVSAQS